MNTVNLKAAGLLALFTIVIAAPSHSAERQIYPIPEQASADIAARYEVPLDKDVPALAVLDRRGKVLYSQKGGEFEPMRHMESSAVTQFLTQWKPPRPAAQLR
jgi:hypothetical protein